MVLSVAVAGVLGSAEGLKLSIDRQDGSHCAKMMIGWLKLVCFATIATKSNILSGTMGTIKCVNLE